MWSLHLVANVCACVILNFVNILQCCCEHVHCTVCGLDYIKNYAVPKYC